MSTKSIITYDNLNTNGAIQNAITSGSIIIKCGGNEIAKFSNGALELNFGRGLKQTISYTPTGTIIPFAGLTAPAGYFVCDGRTLNKNVYDRLFSVINYRYGGAEDNFSIPNLQTKMAIGSASINSMNVPTKDENNSTTNSISGGNAKMETSQLYVHKHNITTSTTNYLFNRDQCQGTAGGANRAVSSDPATFPTETNTQGSSSDMYPPFTVVQYIIKY